MSREKPSILDLILSLRLADGLCEDHRSVDRFLGNCIAEVNEYIFAITLNFIFTVLKFGILH